MSIFGDIVHKIIGKANPSVQPPSFASLFIPPPYVFGGSNAGTPPPATPTPAPNAVLANVDVAAIMDQFAKDSKEPLNWKQSIVDLMKLLQMDSSLANRKQLATELKYNGDMNDSASMNIWLHKQLMQTLVANGGKLPDQLLKA